MLLGRGRCIPRHTAKNDAHDDLNVEIERDRALKHRSVPTGKDALGVRSRDGRENRGICHGRW